MDKNEFFDHLADRMISYGAYKARVIPVSDVETDESFRRLCEQNVCKCYGTNWGCPPGAGDIATCLGRIRKFDRAAVVYHRYKVDIKDADALKSYSGKLQNLLRAMQNFLRARNYGCMCLSDGGCNYCGKCNYPGECRHPDQRIDSVSAYGILLMEYLEDNGLEFKFEEDHVTFYGLIFYSEKADWDNLQNSLKEAFGGKPVYVQFPVNPGTAFDAFVDVLTMKYYKFTDQNGKCTVSDIPAEFADQAETMHAELVEKAAEYDEELMMKFFDEGDLSEEEIIKGLSTGYANGDAYPVFCLSAKKDVGVRRLLEFITHLGIVPAGNESAPASLYIYKTDVEQHLGEVSFFKVMSGIVTTGVDFEEPNSGSKERFSALYAVAGLKKESVTSLHAGDFGCVVKLKNGKAGTTLCAIGAGLDYGKIAYPAPKYRCAIKAKVQQDEQKLGDALKKIASQDPTVIVEYSKELRQTILSGNGEQHINVVKWRLNNEFGLDVELFAPKVPYRETITKVACAQYRHKKQSGGAGQFGEVHLLVCPAEGELNTKFMINGKETVLNIKSQDITDLEWGGKLEFYNCVVGGAIDLSFMPAILKGIKERMVEGPLTGSYARDIRVFVYDGKMHPVDSKEIAFIIAPSAP